MEELEDGSLYQGQYKLGTNTPHGIGTLITKDGGLYEGHWKDGKQDGVGRWIHPQG